MTIVIILFCVFMTTLAVCKCWVKDEKSSKYKQITSILTVGSGVTGFFVLCSMLPLPAHPEVNEIYFYAKGNTKQFFFCCEFFARNDGDTLCKLEKVEFIMNNTEFKLGKSATMTVGAGGSSNVIYNYSPPTKKYIASSTFPQSLPSTNQSFRIIGEGSDSTVLADFDSVSVEIKFHFISKNKPIVVHRTVPVTRRTIEEVSFQ